MSSAALQQFEQVIEEMTMVFLELTGIARVKLSAVRQGRVATLEECMTKEQSAQMKLKGLEIKRERLQTDMGVAGRSFREILTRVTDEERLRLLPLFEGLSREIQMFQQINDDVNSIIRIQQRQLEKQLGTNKGVFEQVSTPSRTDRSV